MASRTGVLTGDHKGRPYGLAARREVRGTNRRGRACPVPLSDPPVGIRAGDRAPRRAR